MPIYKTLDVYVRCVQARRLECCHCLKPFTYLHSEIISAQSTGVPLISSDDSMGDAATKQALKQIPKLAKKEQAGKGLCPHCKRYQTWMVRSSFQTHVIWGIIVGGLVGAIAAPLLNGVLEWRYDIVDAAVTGGLILGTLGLVIGYLTRIKEGPHRNRKHPESMTDEQLKEFLAECEENDYDPFKYWSVSKGKAPKEGLGFVSLGMKDSTQRPIFPVELSTARVLRELRAQTTK